MMKTKEDYIKQAKLKLDKLDAQIDLLEAEASKAKVEASESYHSRLADLKSKRGKVSKKYQDIKDSTGDAWMKLKDGFDNVMDDIQATYRNTKEAITH